MVCFSSRHDGIHFGGRYAVTASTEFRLRRPHMTERYEKHIAATMPGQKAVELLADAVPLSKQQLKSVMTNGAVWLETVHGIKRIRRAKKPLKQGEMLHLYYDSDIQAQAAIPARLVADEGDYSIWDKPRGMYSQGSKWGDHCTVYRWAEQHLLPSRSAYLVHRLDRAARGLIIIAHNKRTANAFAQMFRNHRITKRYRATVEGDLSAIALPYRIDEPLDGKQAISRILQTDYDAISHTTSLLIDISTGRKHQIRRHLSSLGYPIVGDRRYGAADTSEDLQLSSVYLSFTCPIKNNLREYTL